MHDGRLQALPVVILYACLLVSAALAGDPMGGSGLSQHLESFESGVPTAWRAPREDAFRVETRRVKHGQQALGWEWQAGDSVHIATPIAADVRMRTPWFYPSFFMWIYQSAPLTGKLAVELVSDGKVLATVEADLGFQGWECLCFPYESIEQLVADGAPAVDEIILRAPADVRSGSLILDAVLFDAGANGVRIPGTLTADERGEPSASWQAFEAETEAARRPLSETERSAIQALDEQVLEFAMQRLPFGNWRQASEANFRKIMDRYEAFGLARDELGVYSTTGKHLAAWGGTRLHADFASIQDWSLTLAGLARLYHGLPPESERRATVAEAYCQLWDHLAAQGFRRGGLYRLNWYGGFPLALSVFCMRDVLSAHGTLDQAASYIRWAYHVEGNLTPKSRETAVVHMDYFGMDVPVTMLCAVMEGDPWRRYATVRRFSANLSEDILAINTDWGGFRPDGSAFHHKAHYYAYLRYCGAALVEVVHALSSPDFAISQEAYDRLKLVYLNLRFYTNGEPSPNLGGRHPFNSQFNKLRENSQPFRHLALANPSLPMGTADPELAAAYLRINDKADGGEDFNDPELRPEPQPTGNLSMPFANLSAHRRSSWLALARAPSKYLWTSELFAGRSLETIENRYGRYQGAGTLDIFSGKDLGRTGYARKGWDLTHFPGSTALRLDKGALDDRKQHPQIYTDAICVGGLSFQGRNGSFAADFNEPSVEHGVAARKSYFFLDDIIVALGSNIQSDDPDTPVDTTLLQLHAPEHAPVLVDDALIAAFPSQTTVESSEDFTRILDARSTGYIVFPGQQVHLRRSLQTDLYKADGAEAPFTTAWIEHGIQPQQALYHYLVLPDTTESAIKELCSQLAQATPPIEITAQDASAHVIHDRRQRRWAGVLFSADALSSQPAPTARHGEARLIVKGNSLPCLFMTETDTSGEVVQLAVADPDLRARVIEGGGNFSTARVEYGSSTLNLLLAGRWELHDAPANVHAISVGEDTRLEIACKHGESYDLTLRALAKPR